MNSRGVHGSCAKRPSPPRVLAQASCRCSLRVPTPRRSQHQDSPALRSRRLRGACPDVRSEAAPSLLSSRSLSLHSRVSWESYSFLCDVVLRVRIWFSRPCYSLKEDIFVGVACTSTHHASAGLGGPRSESLLSQVPRGEWVCFSPFRLLAGTPLPAPLPSAEVASPALTLCPQPAPPPVWKSALS